MKGFRVWGLAISKIIILFFIFLYPIPYTLYPTYASDNDIGYSKLTAASPFYFLKTIREDLELKFAGTPHVTQLREQEFATRRIREVKTLIPINQDLIAPTLENYTYHLKKISLDNDLDTHVAVLMQVYDKAANVKAKMAIRATLYKLIQRYEVSYQPRLSVCNLFYKEASQSSLNQTEKYVLAERARKCKEINK